MALAQECHPLALADQGDALAAVPVVPEVGGVGTYHPVSGYGRVRDRDGSRDDCRVGHCLVDALADGDVGVGLGHLVHA